MTLFDRARWMRRGGSFPLLLVLIMGVLLAGPARSDSDEAGSMEQMDYGSVIAHSYRCPQINRRVKQGLAIRAGHGVLAVFDTDRLTYATAVKEGAIDLTNTDYLRTKGQRVPLLNGGPLFRTGSGVGVAGGTSLRDPRQKGYGLLPPEYGRFQGYHRHGERVILSYETGSGLVREWPRAIRARDHVAFVRSIRYEGLDQDKRLLIAKEPVVRDASATEDRVDLDLRTGRLVAALENAPDGVRFSLSDRRRVRLHLPASSSPGTVHVVMTRFSSASGAPGTTRSRTVSALRRKARKTVPWTDWTEGGPSRWPKTLKRSGQRAEDTDPYVVDRVPVPEENPWGSFIRLTGIDFFEDGRAAVCTMNGDVWLVGNLNERLQNVTWKRYASGLYQPLGLVVRDGRIFVLEQGQITRLTDLNGDREADVYERFHGAGPFKPRAYWMGLETDSEGQFYYVRDGHRARNMPEHGALMQVSADGGEVERFAYGLRQANGLGINDQDEIQIGDQQGNWVPATRIDRIQKGRFYGYRPHAPNEIAHFPYSRPITWIPQNVDNSAGDQVYVEREDWGPLSNRWLHTSWGRARLFAVLEETVDGRRQGGVVRVPLGSFSAGLLRATFQPEGPLYMTGIGVPGWASVSTSTNTFHRIRYTGQPAYLPVSLNALDDGLRITFSRPLRGRTAADPDRYTVKRWTYRYSEAYGSPELSLREEGKEQRDPVRVSDVHLRNDGRTVLLEIPNMKPARQVMIRYDLETPDGKPVNNTIYHTVHRLGER